MADPSNSTEITIEETKPPSPRWTKTSKIIAGAAILVVLVAIAGALLYFFVLRKSSTSSPHNVNANANVKIRVDSIGVSSLKHSNSQHKHLKAGWDVQFSVVNPSSANVSYDRIDVSLLHGQELLTKATVPPFFVLGAECRPVNARLVTELIPELQEVKATGHKNINTRKGDEIVKVNIVFYAGYRINGVYSAEEASCNNLTVAFSKRFTKGMLFGEASDCLITKSWD